MMKKYLFIAFAIMSISIISCRQDDDLSTTESSLEDIFKKGDSGNHTESNNDSTYVGITPSDPPRNGTHWKGLDSINVSIDPNDPPRNGTHWKTKN